MAYARLRTYILHGRFGKYLVAAIGMTEAAILVMVREGTPDGGPVPHGTPTDILSEQPSDVSAVLLLHWEG